MVRASTRRSFQDDRPRDVKAATFALPIDLLQRMNVAVATGAAPNKTALVERALRHELADIRRMTRRALLEEASRDPLFLHDIEEIERDFAVSDAETAYRII